ncbi:MAG: tetratricopeptide repeat protein [Candidatus Solibacter sp.]
MNLPLLLAMVFSVLSPLAATQVPIMRGRLNAPAGEPVGGLVVNMEGIATHIRTQEVEVRLDGTFEMRDVPMGDYWLFVGDGAGLTYCQQLVTIDEHAPELEVRLPERNFTRATGRATVSLRELAHPPQKKAVQAYQNAMRLSSAGKHDDAVTELEKAIRISPEFTAAHINLAVQHFLLGRFEESAAESAQAIQIGGPDPTKLCNLAIAQARLHRYDEAERSARAALQLDSHFVRANMLVGLLLVDEPARRAEAMKHLEKAASESNVARQVLELLQASH